MVLSKRELVSCPAQHGKEFIGKNWYLGETLHSGIDKDIAARLCNYV